MDTNLAVNLIKRPAYALVGLLAGDAALLLFLLQNALRIRADLLVLHMGEPARQIPGALQLFVLYARLSFVGWLLVGLPIALFFPAPFVTSLWWPLRVFVGAALGPLALLAILALLDRGHIGFPGIQGHELAVDFLNFGFHCFFCLVRNPAPQRKGCCMDGQGFGEWRRGDCNFLDHFIFLARP